MKEKDPFDFWYAVNNTEVLRLPTNKLETFGTSVLNYHLVSELMDKVGKVRVREGRIETFRPQIVTPQSYEESLLDGFGSEAGKYIEWLREHERDLFILKYGFTIKKSEINDHVVSESLNLVVDRVQADLDDKDDALGALVVGVEDPWEVCLLKLMVEVAQRSFADNLRDLKRDPTGSRHEIERAFLAASKDPSLITELSDKLREYKLFEEYEDRFFSLVRSRT